MARETVLNAFGKGIKAACSGALITENPYASETKLAEAWTRGWARAADVSHVLAEAHPTRTLPVSDQALQRATHRKRPPHQPQSQ
jgi:hypothetical protein